jgi:hypothetical protein
MAGPDHTKPRHSDVSRSSVLAADARLGPFRNPPGGKLCADIVQQTGEDHV